MRSFHFITREATRLSLSRLVIMSTRAAMRKESRQQLGIDARQIAVGFLGRLSPEKNPTVVARAVAELPDRYCAVFVGPAGPEVLAEIEGITKRFRHLPAVRPAETNQWLAALDVLVCPSEFESFGLSIVEEIALILSSITRESGMTLLIVEQNIEMALTVASRVAFVEQGRITASVPSAALSADPALIERHLTL